MTSQMLCFPFLFNKEIIIVLSNVKIEHKTISNVDGRQFFFELLGVSLCVHVCVFLNAYITTSFPNNCVTALTDNLKLIIDNLFEKSKCVNEKTIFRHIYFKVLILI